MSTLQLQQYIESSDLSESDKNVWLRTMEVMDDEQAQAVIDAVGEDPHKLEAFTRNVKLKQIAFANGDLTLLEQILKEESDEIARL